MGRTKDRRADFLIAAGIAAFLAAPGGVAYGDTGSGGHAKSAVGGERTPKPVVFSADDVTYDDQLDIITARGNVEMSQSGKTVLADVVSYNQRSDTVIASGNVSLIEEATGETIFGNYVELHDNMRDGFIRDVRMLMADRSRLAGNGARRTDGNRTELVRGVYSPCDRCQSDPSAPPAWEIKAATITHDKEEQLLEFYDATLEIDGIPAFWVPYLSHPDPTVKRQSGFLPPSIGNNSILGMYTSVPYFWVLSDDKDLTITPFLTTLQSGVAELEYRERFDAGFIDLNGSFTDSNPDPGGPSNTDQLRGHFFATGEFDIDDNLRAGFNIQRVSDIIYLTEYKVGAYQNFLRSSVDLEDFNQRDYGSVFAYGFQSLQSDVKNRIQPVVLPVATYTWASAPLDWGGKFTTTVNALDLVRESGSSDRRVSLGSEFDLPFTAFDGQRFNFLAAMRGDGYYATSEQLIPSGPLSDHSTVRAFPQVGLEWNYPWALADHNSNWIVEPRAAIYAAPPGLNPSSIPNDDSGAVDYNDADLFNRNRFAGYDRVDSGQHVDYGLQVDWHGNHNTGLDMLVGQSWRFQQQSPFAVEGVGDGLDRQMSDYVGRIDLTPGSFFDVSYRFRFDQVDLRPARQEITVDTDTAPVTTSVTYLQVGENEHDNETPRQQINLEFTVGLSTYWSTYASATHDLQGASPLLAAEVGARYTDECMTFVASVGTDGIVIENFRPGTTVMVQLVLKNLGVINMPLLETTLGQ